MTESSWDRVVHEDATGPRAPWYEARRQVMSHVLTAVATSNWHQHLVLRGSVTLRAWFGAKAREPVDLDFVVVPHRWRWNDVPADHMHEDLVARAADLAAAAGGVRIRPSTGCAENIHRFPYGDIPGRRVAVLWESTDAGSGYLDIDFAFGETLPTAPIRTVIPQLCSSGAPIVLPTVDPSLSLAWKLAWLEAETNDESRARGKDLFDAVLLAEHCAPDLLRDAVLPFCRAHRQTPSKYLAYLTHWARCVDWDSFAEDYPLLESAHDEFTERLSRALAPALQNPE
ncbi:nucleotidyl transferase AbiEii/AbiGii toxin family protein [Nocardia sp. NPDC020380]|uniref:nucleotidyl transferase AbiEii/AbiGii toxin family protein n=1 Tax=Nocardia sp. NPDC020380 TaxID=3364309 RepID=UPI0037BADEC0